jgi:Tol biopolymer transport system component
LGVRAWLATVVALGAVIAAVPGSATSVPAVRTLAVVPGPIESFAQAGDRIAWLAASKRCYRRAFVRSLGSGQQTVIDARRGYLCVYGERTTPDPDGLAFDGKRALWSYTYPSNTGEHHEFLTAALDDRVERWIDYAVDDHEDHNPGPLVMAGGRGVLLAYSYCDYESDACVGSGVTSAGSVARIRGRSSTALAPGPKGETHLLDLEVSAGRFATVRNEVHRSCCSSDPSWSPDGRRIVLTSRPAANECSICAAGDLYITDADGRNRRRLTETPDDETDPDWSPDSSRIAAAAALGKGPRNVYLYDVTTGAGTRLSAGFAPAWSPDGSQLAVLRNLPGERLDVRLVDPVSGGDGRLLLSSTSLGWNGNDVAWRPDGKELALATNNGLYAVTVPGGLVRPLGYSNPPWGAGSVDWSPDGTLVLFTDLQPQVMPAAGLRMVRADASRGPEFNGTYPSTADMSGEWSPDGSRIAFASDRAEPQPDPDFLELYVAEPTGGNARSITHTPTTLLPVAEVRRVADGRLAARATTKRPGTAATAVALSSRILALLLRPTRNPWYEPLDRRKAWLELFDSRTGRALGSVALPPQTADDPKASGWTVVFRTGTTIRALDARTKRMRVLARARTTPIGLSIDGRRVAWAENGGRVARIRAVMLP